ncbi:MAG: ATP synthase F1 subunit epsilon [Candidatus Eisenbacteria bacterium]
MAKAYRLSVLTPEREVFEGEVDYLEAPGIEGYFGVLADHASFVTALVPGTVRLRPVAGGERRITVTGGLFEVGGNQATLLADGVEGDLK